jgi:MSHA biogenesis protein MshP
MRPERVIRRHQRGLGLVSAIFIITVGALLAAGMGKLMTSGQTQTVESFQSTRALLAAESGVQLYLNQLIHPQTSGGCAVSNAASDTYTFTASGISGCRAEVSCSVSTVAGQDYATIVSVGRCGGTSAALDTASRRIRVRAIRP